MDEEMGISRDEVTQIFEALFDIRSGVSRVLGYIEGRTMAKKKRKMLDSPEERAAFYARWDENTRKLEARIEKLKAEQAARRKRSGES